MITTAFAFFLVFLTSTTIEPGQTVTDYNGLHCTIIGSRIENDRTHVLVHYDFNKYGMYLCDHAEADSVKALADACCMQPLETAILNFPGFPGLAKNYITKKDFNNHKLKN